MERPLFTQVMRDSAGAMLPASNKKAAIRARLRKEGRSMLTGRR